MPEVLFVSVHARRATTTTLALYGHPFPDRLDELAGRLDDAVRSGRAPGPIVDDAEGDQ